MLLTIIIVNWNTSEHLYNCLESITKSSDDIAGNIIVVDNNSSDNSREMVKNNFPDVHLINSGGNIGFGRANNIAIPLAKTPYILFLNPDTIVNEHALNKLSIFLNNNLRVGAVGCKIIDTQGQIVELPLQVEATPLKRFFLQIFFSKRSSNFIKMLFPWQNVLESGCVRQLYGACLMVRKKVLDQVGYFDERFFMYAEDIDLCQRIHAAGWHLYYLADVDIIHLEGGASDKAPSEFSILMMCESISKLMKKNYGRKGELIYKFGVFISSFSRLLLLSLCNIRSFFSSSYKYSPYAQQRRKHIIVLKWCLKI